jgi:tripartite-type tricarboxylate transporter receptor subunit TctC
MSLLLASSRAARFATACLIAAFFLAPAHAGDLDALKGKTIRVIIGSTPGGTNDTVMRGFFKFLEETLPETTIRLQNVAGSGGAKAIKELQDSDGNLVTLASFNSAPLFAQLVSPEALPYDLGKVQWIGSLTKLQRVLAVRAELGVPTLDDVRSMDRQPLIATGDANNASTIGALLLNTVLGLRMKVVTGTEDAQQDAMLLSGDVDAKLGAIIELKPHLDSGLLVPIANLTKDNIPDSLKSVPSIVEAAAPSVPHDVVAMVENLNKMSFLLVASPSTAPDVVTALRAAFDATAANPALVAFVEKAGLAVTPTSGAELAVQTEKMFGPSSAALQEAFKSLLACGKKMSEGAKGCE